MSDSNLKRKGAQQGGPSQGPHGGALAKKAKVEDKAGSPPGSASAASDGFIVMIDKDKDGKKETRRYVPWKKEDFQVSALEKVGNHRSIEFKYLDPLTSTYAPFYLRNPPMRAPLGATDFNGDQNYSVVLNFDASDPEVTAFKKVWHEMMECYTNAVEENKAKWIADGEDLTRESVRSALFRDPRKPKKNKKDPTKSYEQIVVKIPRKALEVNVFDDLADDPTAKQNFLAVIQQDSMVECISRPSGYIQDKYGATLSAIQMVRTGTSLVPAPSERV